MTVEVAKRRTRKPKVAPASETLAIGEIDQTVFACPSCARPLALGARRCPGCGTRLIMGVQARRASMFMGAGVAAGLVVSILFAVVTSAIGGAFGGGDPAAIAAASASASPAPSDRTPAPPTSPPATAGAGSTSDVPALSRSALGQAVGVDARLESSGQALAAALAASDFDTIGAAAILRAMSADAVVGLQLSTHIGAWPGGKTLSGELTSFYSAVQQTAAEGLSASIRNEEAYQDAAQRMVVLLGGLAALDGRLRDVAVDAGVTLPTPAP